MPSDLDSGCNYQMVAVPWNFYSETRFFECPIVHQRELFRCQKSRFSEPFSSLNEIRGIRGNLPPPPYISVEVTRRG